MVVCRLECASSAVRVALQRWKAIVLRAAAAPLIIIPTTTSPCPSDNGVLSAAAICLLRLEAWGPEDGTRQNRVLPHRGRGRAHPGGAHTHATPGEWTHQTPSLRSCRTWLSYNTAATSPRTLSPPGVSATSATRKLPGEHKARSQKQRVPGATTGVRSCCHDMQSSGLLRETHGPFLTQSNLLKRLGMRTSILAACWSSTWCQDRCVRRARVKTKVLRFPAAPAARAFVRRCVSTSSAHLEDVTSSVLADA